MPSFPLFQYQAFTEPVVSGAEATSEDKWHFEWAPPVRFLRITAACMAASGLYETLGADPREAITEDRWHQPWSEPYLKVKPIGLRAASQQAIAFQHPFVSFSWFDWLSDPVRVKPGLRASLQQFFAGDTTVIPTSKLIEWYANLSEPVRLKIGIAARLQQFFAAPSQLRPTPTTTGVLDAVETKDIMLAAARVWETVTSGEIGVIENAIGDGEAGVSASNMITSASVSIRIVV